MEINLLSSINKNIEADSFDIDPMNTAFEKVSDEEKTILTALESWITSAVNTSFKDAPDSAKIEVFNNVLNNLFNHSGAEEEVSVEYLMLMLSVLSFALNDVIYYGSVNLTVNEMKMLIASINDCIDIITNDITFIIGNYGANLVSIDTARKESAIKELNETVVKTGMITNTDTILKLSHKIDSLLDNIGASEFAKSKELVDNRVNSMRVKIGELSGMFRSLLELAAGINGSYAKYINNMPHTRAIRYMSKVCTSMMPTRTADMTFTTLASIKALNSLIAEFSKGISSRRTEKASEEPLGTHASQIYYGLALVNIYDFIKSANNVIASYTECINSGATLDKEILSSGIVASAVKLKSELKEVQTFIEEMQTSYSEGLDFGQFDFLVAKCTAQGSDRIPYLLSRHRWSELLTVDGLTSNFSGAMTMTAKMADKQVMSELSPTIMTMATGTASLKAPDFLFNITKLKILRNNSDVIKKSRNTVLSSVATSVSELADKLVADILQQWEVSKLKMVSLLGESDVQAAAESLIEEIKVMTRNTVSAIDRSDLKKIEITSAGLLNFIITSNMTNAAVNALEITTNEEMDIVFNYVNEYMQNIKSVVKTVVLGGI